jgi:hypothetical protein
MAYKKELSKCCVKCGVEWLADFSNKTPKRALCLECKREYDKEYSAKDAKTRKRLYNRMEKGKAFKIENRKHIHKAVNLELRKLKDRTEIREFLRKRFDELLEDKALWDYINDTDVLNKFEN